MSDLAPFVAAALRDRNIEELMEENKKFRNENKKLQEENRVLKARVIRVTRPGGSPIYAQRHIAYANETEQGFLVLNLHATTLPMCPIEDMERCEVHIGGDQTVIRVGDYSSALQRTVPIAPEQSMDYNYSFRETETAEENDEEVEEEADQEEFSATLIVIWGPTTRLEDPSLSPAELATKILIMSPLSVLRFLSMIHLPEWNDCFQTYIFLPQGTMILAYIASSKTVLIISTNCKLSSDLSSVGTVWTHPSSRSCSANLRLIRFVRLFCVLPKHTQTRQVVVKVSSDWSILLNINISSLALVGQPVTIVPGFVLTPSIHTVATQQHLHYGSRQQIRIRRVESNLLPSASLPEWRQTSRPEYCTNADPRRFAVARIIQATKTPSTR